MKTLIKCGQLFDSYSGETESGRSILTDGGTVAWVGKSGDCPQDADTVIDLEDKFVMPGLIDAHVHTGFDGQPGTMTKMMSATIGEIAVEVIVNARADLMAGFTLLRDEGCMGFADVAVRNAIDAGKIDGPRLFVSGCPITATGGHADGHLSPYYRQDPFIFGAVADSPDAGRQAARMNLKYGADQIKIMATGGVMSVGDLPGAPEFSEEEVQAILAVPRSRGRISSAHAHGAEGIKMAIRAGITSIEHGMMMDDACIGMMAEGGVYLVPTVIAAVSILEMGMAGGLTEETVRKSAQCLEKDAENLKKCREKGVGIVFGTDAGTFGNYHGRQAREFSLMREYGGFTVTELLRSATCVSAQMMHLEGKAGCIRPGAWADIVASDASPYEDLGTLERISFVMKAGKVYKAPQAV